MGARRPLVAGNWKMFKGPGEATTFAGELATRLATVRDVDVVVCPPFTALAETIRALGGSPIRVFAQNVHWAAEGPFTGEVSPSMLRELGVGGTLVAHSERRQLFGESDESAAMRIDGALAHGLDVIACVGELEEEREAGRTEEILERQVAAIAPLVSGAERERLTLAYEPVWAIGTGRVATPDEAEEAHARIRSLLDVPILYGGSVKPDNAEELLAQTNVDGALVGGASLEAESFASICEAAIRIRS